MRDTNFKVGDRVRIRQWDDMEAEYGLRASGSIKCNGAFTEEMKELCGKERTIKKIFNGIVEFKKERRDKNSGLDWGWGFSTDMIEKVSAKGKEEFPEAKQFKAGDIVELRTLEDLIAEYGKAVNGDIKTTGLPLLSKMQAFIEKNRKATIEYVSSEGNISFYNDMFVYPMCVVKCLAVPVPEKKRKKTPEPRKPKVGDKVWLRPWDELVAEFGENGNGDIKIDGCNIWKKSMKPYFGGKVTVEELSSPQERFRASGDDGKYWWYPYCTIDWNRSEKQVPEFEFKVGDVVQVREWDDMKAEYGLRSDDYIDTSPYITNDRDKELCGRTAKIDDIDFDWNNDGSGVIKVNLVDIEDQDGYTYIFPACAIYAIQDEEPKSRKKEGQTEPCKCNAISGKCEQCKRKKPLAGGYLFCESWWNITVPDGFCHKFEMEVDTNGRAI